MVFEGTRQGDGDDVASVVVSPRCVGALECFAAECGLEIGKGLDVRKKTSRAFVWG